MTDQELKDLVASLAIQSAKNHAETAKNNAAYEKRMAKNDAERAETAKLVKALTKDIFGISTSMGLEAEDFFYSALSSKLQLAGGLILITLIKMIIPTSKARSNKLIFC